MASHGKLCQDQLTGEKSTVKGPTVWFPGPFEQSGKKLTAIALQDDEYIKVKDVFLACFHRFLAVHEVIGQEVGAAG